MTIGKIIDHYEKLIRALAESPIIMAIRMAAYSPKGLRKEACHDSGYVDIHVYLGARCLESDRDFLRSRRPVRHVQREKTQWLDGALSRHHGFDERDWVLFSLRQFRAAPCGRRHIAGGAGGRDPRALCLSPHGILALDLRRRRRGGP